MAIAVAVRAVAVAGTISVSVAEAIGFQLSLETKTQQRQTLKSITIDNARGERKTRQGRRKRGGYLDYGDTESCHRVYRSRT